MSLPIRIARLQSTGATDTTFNPGAGLNAAGLCVAVLPATGKVIVGGEFTEAAGQARQRLAVFSDSGSLEATVLNANQEVRTLIAEADGKVILGGDFTQLAGTARNRIARLKSDLVVEPAYNPNPNGAVYALAGQADGMTLCGGAFTSIGTGTRSRIARLHNDAAANGLAAKSPSLVIWQRGGTRPESERVTFEISTDGGSTWTALGGVVTRLDGHWQVTGLSLTGAGLIRARAYPGDSHSASLHEATTEFDVAPKLVVRQVVETEIPAEEEGAPPHLETTEEPLENGDDLPMGEAQVGIGVKKTLVIRNEGLLDLELTGGTPVTITGALAGQFRIEPPLIFQIPPQESATFVVHFKPTSTGGKAAVLNIASNDTAMDPFTLDLLGTGMPGWGSRDLTPDPVSGKIYQPLPDNAALVLIPAGDTLLAGGHFTMMNGLKQVRISRLAADGGTLPISGAGANGLINTMIQLPDGKFLIGGEFTTVSSVARHGLARLLPDGSLDPTFKIGAYYGPVSRLALQPDGAVIVAGSFTYIGAVTADGRRNGLARLLPTGALDPSFNPSITWGYTGNPGAVEVVAVQSDGKILVGGNWRSLAGKTSRLGLARLNANGSLDESFDAKLAWGTQPTAQISSIAVDSEGRILIGGSFSHVHSTAVSRFCRLTATGSLDTSFTGPALAVKSLLPQADGRIILTGYEISGSVMTAKLIRIEEDGTEDTSFVASLAGSPYAACMGPGGAVFVCGIFSIGHVTIARLLNGPRSTQDSLTVQRTQVQWQRGDITPEASHVNFDLSEDAGATWKGLGQAARIPGGWQLSGLSLPKSGMVRGRACIVGSDSNRGSGLHEARKTFAGFTAPDILLKVGATTVSNGGVIPFTNVLKDQISNVELTIVNNGLAELSGLTFTFRNRDTARGPEWFLINLGQTNLAAGAQTTAVLQFKPAATGYRETYLTIASNVPGARGSITLTLRGAGHAAPVISSIPALDSVLLTATQARLRVNVIPNDDDAKVWFRYKKLTQPDTEWVTVPPATPASVSGFGVVSVHHDISGLTAATQYRYQPFITNATGGAPVAGAITAFTTDPP
ncbi:MAG TPA: choice-of-anchor D domain-containing protein [Prosthecobacter sp.]|nr:choice-of-anchor D domain-containing protein [Prosthecobacter sp.]